MKKCSFCGTENFDISDVCSRCKNPLKPTVSESFTPPSMQSYRQPYQQPTEYQARVTASPWGNPLKMAAKVFLYIRIISTWISFFVVSVLWLIAIFTPASEAHDILSVSAFVLLCVCLGVAVFITCISRSYFNKVDERIPVGTGFKICILLFVDFIAGILMLCDNDEYCRSHYHS